MPPKVRLMLEKTEGPLISKYLVKNKRDNRLFSTYHKSNESFYLELGPIFVDTTLGHLLKILQKTLEDQLTYLVKHLFNLLC